jgi:hypothetical protein
MKVYIVSVSWYNGTDILSVFDTKEKAINFADQHSRDFRNRRENYCIDEMVVK